MLDSAPSAVFGSASGEGAHAIGVVAGALTTGYNEVAIADGASNTIQFFDSTGVWLRSVARPGAGPGEFRRLVGMSRCRGGTLVSADFGTKFVSFGDSGAFAAETPTSMSEHRLLGCIASNDLILQKEGDGSVPDGGGFHRLSARIVRFRSDAASETTLGTFAGTAYFFSQRGPYFLDVPLGAKTLAAVGRNWLFVVETDQPMVEAILLESNEHHEIPVVTERLPVRPGAFDRAFAERLAQIPVASTRKMVAPIRDELPEPREMPFFDAIVADDSDHVWVRTYEGDAEGFRLWYAFNQRGEFLGRLATPSALEVTEIAHGHVLGVLRSTTGGERVVRYRLRRREL